jgi:hypothetical protein
MAAECVWSVIDSDRNTPEAMYAVWTHFGGKVDELEWFQREVELLSGLLRPGIYGTLHCSTASGSGTGTVAK